MNSRRKCGGSLERLGISAVEIQIWTGSLSFASFLGITADEDYGGLAMGYQAHCIVMEEISKASGSLAATPASEIMVSDLPR